MNKKEHTPSGLGRALGNMKQNIRSYTMIIALVVIWGILALLTKGTSLSPRNLSILFRQTAVTGILALGMLLVIVTGNIDMSVGSAMGLLGGIAACCQVWYEMSLPTTIGVVLVFGLLVGAWNGFWVAYMRVPAFIVGLSGYMVYRGVLIGITKSASIAPMTPGFKIIGQGYIPAVFGWILCGIACVAAVFLVLHGRKNRKKYNIAVPSSALTILKLVVILALICGFMFIMADYQGIPIPVLILLCFAVLFTFLTKKTRFGKCIYAIGCNNEAAQLAGIKTKRIVFVTYLIIGVMCAVAGIILTSRLNAGTANAGEMAEMDAIAACVIGGASLSGGIGSVPSAIVGALVMASLDNGMSLLNTPSFWQYIIKGLILLSAVYVDVVTKKKAN